MSTTQPAEEKKSWNAFSKASQMIGVGTPLSKQLKFAILEGNEEKAISIYNAKEMGKALKSTLHPSKPFPSKKDPNGETPLHLSSKFALASLFGMFLEFGGRPDIPNSRLENCLHTVCAQLDNPSKRAEIVEQILKWRSINPSTNKPVAVSTDAVDIDGNTAIHLAAYNGLLNAIQVMLGHQVNAWRLNNTNLTSAEVADVAGRANIGSMIELAWLFRPSTLPGGSTSRWDRALTTFRARMRDYGGEDVGVVLIDSDSLTVSGLMKFVARLIAFVSERLGESAARAEVLLMHYNWDARRLLKEFNEDAERVLRKVNFQVISVASTSSDSQGLTIRKQEESTSTAVALQNLGSMPVGIPIGEVYLDPSYQNLGPFTIVRGGKKVSYTIRTVHGKTAVVPLDFDPSAKMLAHNDQKVSVNSHLRPETTAPCPMCGEMMHEAASVQHFLADTLVEPKHRELACGSGHKYCFSCWSGYLQSHAAGEEGLSGLCCPAVNCGEVLDLHWAPVLLKSPDLLNRMFVQRQRLIIDKLRLRWCPVPECGLVVHVHSAENEQKRGSDVSAQGIPLCGLCNNMHAFCLVCGTDAHSPCKCEDVGKWQELVREVSRTSQAKDSTSAASILLHAPNHKNCPQCGISNGKEDGCNHMRCTGCFREYCWTCLKEWSTHVSADGTAAVPSPCTLAHDPAFSSGLTTRYATFLRYFARYQVHQESSTLETAMSASATDRVLSELRATHEGELQWLLGDDLAVPPLNTHTAALQAQQGSASAEERDVKLADAYLSKEKVLSFLHEAFIELKKCRTLLRWSYPFAMFKFEDDFRRVSSTAMVRGMMVAHPEDRSEYRQVFCSVQSALEVRTEALSDLIAHKRLRGSRDDILEATLLAKTERIALEGIVVGNAQAFGSKSLEFSQSMDERETVTGSSVASFRLSQQSTVPQQAQSQQKVSSYSVAMEADLNEQRQHTNQHNTTTNHTTTTNHNTTTTTTGATTARAAQAQGQEGEDYGYNSGDEEDLQVYNDVSLLKLGGESGKQSSSQNQNQKSATEKREVLTLETGRTSQQAVEEVYTTTRTITTVSGAAITSGGSGNSLLSDLTTQDNNSNSATPVTFAKATKITASASPKPPTDPHSLPAPPARPTSAMSSKASSMSSKGLTRQASKLFMKQQVEHISQSETTIVYQLMAKHKIDRERAVRMNLEEHDERLYNPKAVYLFPGEVYTPEEEVDEEEEERKRQDLFGRVEYNHKQKGDSDSYSMSSASVIEQRLIGAKKDPDQEALEHALLLSAQEDEFGINMYDSLSHQDELTLHEYISQGFTREEGALIIFEEKFGKTKHTRGNSVIPAMPTLQPGQGHVGSTIHTGTDRSGLAYESDEEEDEEVLDLMRRGYTREQAVAVILNHREKARLAALHQHPTDPTHYDPHPQEEQLNLSEREEKDVQAVMDQRRCSRRAAVDVVVAQRDARAAQAAQLASQAAAQHNASLYSAAYEGESAESIEVRRYIDRGYTREQALQLIRSRPAGTSTQNTQSTYQNSSTSHNNSHHSLSAESTSGRRYSFTSTNSGGNESGLTSITNQEDIELARYTSRGYTKEQAREMVRRDGHNGSSARRSLTELSSYPSTANHSFTNHGRSVPLNLDPETAELVRQQDEEYGINMFTAQGSAEDDAQVERLMNEGYTYHEALLQVFTYRYPSRVPPPPPPVAMYAQHSPSMHHPNNVYSYQPHSQSMYMPPQGQYSPYQPVQNTSFYGHSPNASYYQPQMQNQPVPAHAQSFYASNSNNAQDPYYPAPATATASPATNLSRKPSVLNNNSNLNTNTTPYATVTNNNNNNGAKAPVLTGQTSLLQQQRNQDAWVAQNQPVEKKSSSSSLMRKGSFLGGIGGITRKSAHTEGDLVNRATQLEQDPDHKSKVPKLKYKEADVQKIVKMGFTRDQAVQALVENHHNVDEAVHMLTDR